MCRFYVILSHTLALYVVQQKGEFIYLFIFEKEICIYLSGTSVRCEFLIVLYSQRMLETQLVLWEKRRKN